MAPTESHIVEIVSGIGTLLRRDQRIGDAFYVLTVRQHFASRGDQKVLAWSEVLVRLSGVSPAVNPAEPFTLQLPDGRRVDLVDEGGRFIARSELARSPAADSR